MPALRIAIVIGSTRPSRISAGIAEWARDALAAESALDYELLDLADVDLPVLDEPRMAALGQYEHAHTRAWSERVLGFDGFLFLFPQYNWGYPAVLKNAIDFLYSEWRGRPASVFTFGTRGGVMAADQLTQVLNGVHMRVLDARVTAVISKADLDDEWQLIDIAATLAPTRAALREIDAEFAAAIANPTR